MYIWFYGGIILYYIYVHLFLYVIHTDKDYICGQLNNYIQYIYIHLQYIILYVMFYVYSSHLGDPTGNILVSMTLDLLSTGFSMGCDMSWQSYMMEWTRNRGKSKAKPKQHRYFTVFHIICLSHCGNVHWPTAKGIKWDGIRIVA